MRADRKTIDGFARRLIGRLDDPGRFRDDPATAMADAFGLEVRYRDVVEGDCDLIDGSCDYANGIITVADAASPGRRRFTALHELGHYLGKSDGDLVDWLSDQPDLGRAEEEQVANAFAALILLPDEVVDDFIPAEGPTAYDVALLAAQKVASREAVCVRASQRLRGAGLVVLSKGTTVQFAAGRNLPYGLARNSVLPDPSIFTRAAANGHASEDYVRVTLRSGDLSDPLMGDAAADEQGYVFTVLMRDAAPWKPLTPISTPDEDGLHEVDCELCDGVRRTGARECPVCHDRPCPDHGCACQQQLRPTGAVRRCQTCFMQLPLASTSDFCDAHS